LANACAFYPRAIDDPRERAAGRASLITEVDASADAD